jgi:hypothetical protein
MDEQQKQRLCKSCKSPLLPSAKLCTVCQSWQDKPCVACKQRLPSGAKRCVDCGTHQKLWRRALPDNIPGFLTALVAVGSALITAAFWYRDYDSTTSVLVTHLNTSTGKMLCYVWNTGRKPSRVMRSALKFGSFPYKDGDFESGDPTKTIIQPAGAVLLELKLDRLTRRCTEARDIDKMGLWFEIQESNRSRAIKVPVSLSDITNVVLYKKAIDKVDECD